MTYEKHYVWSILLRLYHWAMVSAIVALTVTGFYINSPWTQTTLEGAGLFPMMTMRNIHGLAGYLLTGAIFARIFLLIFGNRQERILDMLPVTRATSRIWSPPWAPTCTLPIRTMKRGWATMLSPG